jgi:hypothetical protein
VGVRFYYAPRRPEGTQLTTPDVRVRATEPGGTTRLTDRGPDAPAKARRHRLLLVGLFAI